MCSRSGVIVRELTAESEIGMSFNEDKLRSESLKLADACRNIVTDFCEPADQVKYFDTLIRELTKTRDEVAASVPDTTTK